MLSEPKTLALETPEQRELRRLRQEPAADTWQVIAAQELRQRLGIDPLGLDFCLGHRASAQRISNDDPDHEGSQQGHNRPGLVVACKAIWSSGRSRSRRLSCVQAKR